MKIRCTRCEKKFKVPQSYQGRKVRCFNCDTVFVATEYVDPEAADLSLWRSAITQMAERYGSYVEEPVEPAARQEEEELIEATLEDDNSASLAPIRFSRMTTISESA